MNDLPPELSSRRDAIHDRVIARGRARRRQRGIAAVLVIAVVVTVPVAALALTARDNGPRRVEAIAPRAGEISTTTSTESTTTSTGSTTPSCHDSRDPACGPFFYDPPITNQPAMMELTVVPAAPRAGDRVTFTLHVTDPDSPISSNFFCGTTTFGEANTTQCMADCAGPGARYGPWAPTPAEPGDATFTEHHVYEKPGTYKASFSTTAGLCSERPSEASASVTVHVSL